MQLHFLVNAVALPGGCRQNHVVNRRANGLGQSHTSASSFAIIDFDGAGERGGVELEVGLVHSRVLNANPQMLVALEKQFVISVVNQLRCLGWQRGGAAQAQSRIWVSSQGRPLAVTTIQHVQALFYGERGQATGGESHYIYLVSLIRLLLKMERRHTDYL